MVAGFVWWWQGSEVDIASEGTKNHGPGDKNDVFIACSPPTWGRVQCEAAYVFNWVIQILGCGSMFVNTWGYALVDDLANSCHADSAQIIEVGPSNMGFQPGFCQVIRLMDEIQHQLISGFSHYLQAFFTSQVVVWDFFH